MSRDSLRPGVMEARGGPSSFPGGEARGGSGPFPGPPPLRPRPGFLDVGASSLPGPAPFPGPGPAPDLHTPVTPSLDMSSCGGGTNGAVPTLTTPTLTPTTLRNIEQMFGEADPHEPPPHHENAAGFVPPIISPTSGNSYVPLGLGDSMCENSDRRGVSRVSPPPLMLGRTKDFSAMSPPPLMMGLSNGGARHTLSPTTRIMGQDRRPISPPPTTITHEKPSSLILGHDKTSTLMLGHEKPPFLALGHEKPPSLMLGHNKLPSLMLGHDKPPSLVLGHDKPSSLMLGHDKPSSLMLGHDKNFSELSSMSGTVKMREELQSSSPRLSRPHSLQLGQLGQFGLNGSSASSLPDETKVELINKFVKAAASFKTCLPGLTQVPSSASTMHVNSLTHRTSVKEEFPQSSEHEEEFDEEMERSPPPSLPYHNPPQAFTSSSERGQKKRQGGRKPATSTGIPPEEELKRVQRRERNKQAAARCRKRRLDQTCTLQVEVDGWEEKRRILKEEIQQLETQKKGLEMVLGRHHGSCKVKAKQGTNSCNKK